MKVLHAPVNIAGQPIAAVRELRRQGVDASLLQYGEGHAFGYSSGRLVPFRGRHRLEVQVEAVEQALAEDNDIFHFWMATFFASPRIPGRGEYQFMHGLDLPFLKLRGKKIVYRCTDFDVRTASLHSAVNPYNPFRYGYEPLFSDAAHREYLSYLREYVDVFVVQDPELHEFMPQARVVPRGLDLAEFPEIGVEPSDRPLVVHAPSKTELKGTRFVLQALDELREEGVPFELRLIEGMSHSEALEWYKRADLVVDQLVIGWYGVLTVEALALGKPVIVRVRDDLRRAFRPEIPVATASPGTIKDVLRTALKDFSYRRALAERARSYVEQVHDIRTVAARLRAIYEDVLEMPENRPETAADLRWLWSRYKASEASEAALIDEIRFGRPPSGTRLLSVRSRRQARRLHKVVAEVGALRSKAILYEQATSPTIVEKARRYDLAAGEIADLWRKAREFDALQELVSLRESTDGSADRRDGAVVRRRLEERFDELRAEVLHLRREAAHLRSEATRGRAVWAGGLAGRRRPVGSSPLSRRGRRRRPVGSSPLSRRGRRRRPWKPAGPAARVAKKILPPKGSRLYQLAFDLYWWCRKKWNVLMNKTLYRVL